MRILKIDEKNSVVEVVPEVLDDLWHLERIIEAGDLVSGLTDRKIKARVEGEEVKRVKLFLKLEVEKVEFHKFSENLRVLGKIVEGKPAELIEQKAHHSLDIEPGKKIRIEKKLLKRHQIERLEKAKKATSEKPVLLVVLDDETATFGVLKEFSLEEKVSIRGKKQGKRFGEETADEKSYLNEVFSKIKELGIETVVVAGPGFTKEKLKKLLEEKKFEGKVFLETTNSVGITGLNELLKGNALEKVVKETQIVKDIKLVEKLFEELGKSSGMVAYGFTEVEKAVDFGAVQTLLVTDKMLLEKRNKVEELIKKVEQLKGEIHILSHDTDPGKKLSSLTGIAALLRYAIK